MDRLAVAALPAKAKPRIAAMASGATRQVMTAERSRTRRRSSLRMMAAISRRAPDHLEVPARLRSYWEATWRARDLAGTASAAMCTSHSRNAMLSKETDEHRGFCVARIEFQGKIGNDWRDSEPWWPPLPDPAGGRAQRRADRARRRGLRAAGLLRVRHRDAGDRRRRRRRRAADELPHHRAVLARRGRVSSPAATTTAAAWAASPTWRAAIPGYWGRPPRENGFLSEMLRSTGYATYAVGKWHLSPEGETNMANSRATWPLGRGFDRWYGFHGGETHQFVPALYHDNHAVRPPRSVEDGLPPQRRPGRPRHRVPGGPARRRRRAAVLLVLRHRRVPLAPPRAGRVDRAVQGPLRQGLGRVARGDLRPPAGHGRRPRGHGADAAAAVGPGLGDARRAASAPWPSGSWSASQRSCPIRTSRSAGCSASSKTSGDAENTVVIDRLGQRGQLRGWARKAPSTRVACRTSMAPASERCTGRIDEIGGPHIHNNYPWGWTMAGNTPFKRWKREVHEGGVADPCIVRLPATRRPGRGGGVRRQYAHADRHHADGARAGRAGATGRDRRHRPVTPRRHQLRLRPGRRRGRRARPASHPALRDARVARHLPRRMEGSDLPPGRARSTTTACGRTRPGTRTSGSSTTSPRTSRSPATAPPSSPRKWPSWSRCGGKRRGATTCFPSTTGCSMSSSHKHDGRRPQDDVPLLPRRCARTRVGRSRRAQPLPRHHGHRRCARRHRALGHAARPRLLARRLVVPCDRRPPALRAQPVRASGSTRSSPTRRSARVATRWRSASRRTSSSGARPTLLQDGTEVGTGRGRALHPGRLQRGDDRAHVWLRVGTCRGSRLRGALRLQRHHRPGRGARHWPGRARPRGGGGGHPRLAVSHGCRSRARRSGASRSWASRSSGRRAPACA